MLYDDDIVLCSTRREEVENKLEEWRRAMEDRGLEISRKNPVYLRFNGDWNLDGNSDINLQGENFENVNCTIQSEWKNWKRGYWVFCDVEE